MNYAVLFYSFLFFFISLSVFSSSFFTFWVGIEISVFFFLPLLGGKVGGVKEASFSSVWNYYFVQVLSSLLLILFLLLSEEEYTSLSLLEKWGVYMALFLKIGLFPFHGWSYHVAESLSWINLFLLSSVVNIPPLYLLSSSLESDVEFIFLLSLLNGSVIVLFLLKELSLKWFFLTSSNYLISWIILASTQGVNEFSTFIISYLLQSVVVISYFLFSSPFGGSGVFLNESAYPLTQGVSLLALMGMPPFSIFMSKITIVSSLLSESSLLAAILLLLSFAASFIYLNSVVLSSLNVESFFFCLVNQNKVCWFMPATLSPSLFFFF